MTNPAFVSILLLSLLTRVVLAADGDELKHPDWHPDGKILVAEGSCAGDNDLYLIDLRSDNVRRIFAGDHADGYPRWFADGLRITFHQIDAERNSRIFVADVSALGEVSNVTAVSSGTFDIEPAPSPDGRLIAFSTPGSNGQDIAILDLEDRVVVRYWSTPDAENFPSWSADGRAVVFHARTSLATQIYQRDLESDQRLALTDSDGPNLVADMGKSGELLTFSSERDGDREIYLRFLHTGTERRITDNAGRDGYPKLSPDERFLSWHSSGGPGHTVVRVLDRESGATREYACDLADIG